MRGGRAIGRQARVRGFTFIELMIVIAILGLLATVVVANLEGLTDDSSLSSSARELGNTILGVRDLATTQARERLRLMRQWFARNVMGRVRVSRRHSIARDLRRPRAGCAPIVAWASRPCAIAERLFAT